MGLFWLICILSCHNRRFFLFQAAGLFAEADAVEEQQAKDNVALQGRVIRMFDQSGIDVMADNTVSSFMLAPLVRA
jgi:hypothetical protein